MRGAGVDERRRLRKSECFNGHEMFIHKINPGDRPSPTFQKSRRLWLSLVDKTRISCQLKFENISQTAALCTTPPGENDTAMENHLIFKYFSWEKQLQAYGSCSIAMLVITRGYPTWSNCQAASGVTAAPQVGFFLGWRLGPGRPVPGVPLIR